MATNVTISEATDDEPAMGDLSSFSSSASQITSTLANAVVNSSQMFFELLTNGSTVDIISPQPDIVNNNSIISNSSGLYYNNQTTFVPTYGPENSTAATSPSLPPPLETSSTTTILSSAVKSLLFSATTTSFLPAALKTSTGVPTNVAATAASSIINNINSLKNNSSDSDLLLLDANATILFTRNSSASTTTDESIFLASTTTTHEPVSVSSTILAAASRVFKELSEATIALTTTTRTPSTNLLNQHLHNLPAVRTGSNQTWPTPLFHTTTSTMTRLITYESPTTAADVNSSAVLFDDSDEEFFVRYNPFNWQHAQFENFALVLVIAGLLIFGLLCAFIGFCFGCWSERRRRSYEASSLSMFESSHNSRAGSNGRNHQIIHFGDESCPQGAYYNNSITTRSAKGNCIISDHGANNGLLGAGSSLGTNSRSPRTMICDDDATLHADRI